MYRIVMMIAIVCLLHAQEYRPPAQVQKGIEAFRSKHFDRAYAMLASWAEKGDRAAQFYVGLLYDMGTIGMMDKTEAVRWYRKAADQGYAPALYDMGVMCSKGEGIEKDLAAALEWYRKAADQGYAPALYNLGVAWERGYGVEANRTKALEYYREAAQKGIAKGAFNASVLYEKTGEYTRALQMLRQASRLGHPKAQYRLGWIYEHGIGVAHDLAKAKEWYRKAAANGDRNAAYRYGVLLEREGNPEGAFWKALSPSP